jgi:hypothetical protein
MTTYDVREGAAHAAGVDAAVGALRRGELAVLPTDTVYGIAADAFSPAAVGRLLEAKGRTREMPVPVLVGSWRTIDGLAEVVTPVARRLVEAFWPGPLTLVVRAAPSLAWDLGETRGTVAVRMPLHPVALACPRADRPARRQQRQPHRPATCHRRRGGRPAAGQRRLGLPRQRPDGLLGALDHRRPHRGRAPAAAGRRPLGRAAARGGAGPGAARRPGAGVTGAVPFRVLHVCTGNICRSPMAELLMRRMLDRGWPEQAERFVVESAGTWGHAGSPMEPHAHSTLAAHGVDGSAFRARELAAEHVAGRRPRPGRDP